MTSSNGSKMVILSSPSGAGKTTLTKKIQQKYQNFKISVSHTTRKPRSDEVDGIDYVGWLQNPDTMRVIKQEDVPTELQKYMRGQRRSVPSGHVRRKRIRDGEPTREDGSASVKIPPEFRWGKYKPL